MGTPKCAYTRIRSLYAHVQDTHTLSVDQCSCRARGMWEMTHAKYTQMYTHAHYKGMHVHIKMHAMHHIQTCNLIHFATFPISSVLMKINFPLSSSTPVILPMASRPSTRLRTSCALRLNLAATCIDLCMQVLCVYARTYIHRPRDSRQGRPPLVGCEVEVGSLLFSCTHAKCLYTHVYAWVYLRAGIIIHVNAVNTVNDCNTKLVAQC
jgi:hypothetical protein